WTSSSSTVGRNSPDAQAASRSSSAASIRPSSAESSSPAPASTRAWAREPARSYGARRQSKWTGRDRRGTASAGQPRTRPPHRRVEPSVSDWSFTLPTLAGEAGVARRGEPARQAPQIDEPLGERLVEHVSLVVRGETEVVQARLGAAAGDRR